MSGSNKFNFVLIILLAFTISIACNLTASDQTNEKSEMKSGGGESGSEVTKDTDVDSELSLNLEDDDPKEDSKAIQKENPNQTTVKFAKGKTSRNYEHAVIRSEKHTYTLGASEGQIMSVSIKSLEDNANFYILSPDKTFVGDGSEEEGITQFDDVLEKTGNYKIVVSPTRGNATYKINFGVSAKEKTAPPTSGGSLTKNVKFGKGRSSASYSNSVIRGESDTYILGASGGQLMSVSISSTENNAVFSIDSPTGGSLINESRNWSGQLPSNGKYRINVGGTRGNATYKINFSVK